MRTINETILDGRDVGRLVRACARAHGLAPWALDGLTLHLRHDDGLASLFNASVRGSTAEIVLAPPERWTPLDVVGQLAGLANEDEVPPHVVRALHVAIEFVVRARQTRRHPTQSAAPWGVGARVRVATRATRAAARDRSDWVARAAPDPLRCAPS